MAVAALLASCDGPSVPPPTPEEDSTVAAAEAAAQQEMAAKLATIAYPACDTVWKGDKLSACGRRVMETSLTNCQSLGAEQLGGSPSLLDEYAGDSWIERAGGKYAVASIDERVDKTRRGALLLETFAYALGNGTDTIRTVTCRMDERLHLTSF